MQTKYEVLGIVGEGAYGIVYKCKNKETNEIVAIKKFKETEDDLVKKTIKRELKVLKLLKHENIVEFKEAIKQKNNIYIVFEYVEKNLLEFLQENNNKIPENKIKIILYQLCKALKYLHKNNIIHRDIKPENLLIDSKNYKLKLCDFGFARKIKKTNIKNTKNPKNELLTDYVATRWYRSPELLISNGNYNFEVDYWAAGCIMGELIDGNPIFPGENEIDQLHCIQKILGNFPQEYIDLFYNNPVYSQFDLIDVKKPTGLDKKYFGKLNKDGVLFLKGLLELDPKKRLCDDNVLEHCYFKDFYKRDCFSFYYEDSQNEFLNCNSKDKVKLNNHNLNIINKDNNCDNDNENNDFHIKDDINKFNQGDNSLSNRDSYYDNFKNVSIKNEKDNSFVINKEKNYNNNVNISCGKNNNCSNIVNYSNIYLNNLNNNKNNLNDINKGRNDNNCKKKGLAYSISNKNILDNDCEKIIKKIMKIKNNKNEEIEKEKKEKKEKNNENENKIIINNNKIIHNSNSTTNINIINVNTYNNNQNNEINIQPKLTNSNEIKFIKKNNNIVPNKLKNKLKNKKIKENKTKYMAVTMSNQIYKDNSNLNNQNSNLNRTMISDLNSLTARQKYEILNNDFTFIQNINQEKLTDRGTNMNILSILKRNNINFFNKQIFGFKTFFKNQNDNYNYNINTHFNNIGKTNIKKKPKKTRHSSIIEEVEEHDFKFNNNNNNTNLNYFKKDNLNHRKSRSLNHCQKKLNHNYSTGNYYYSPIKENKIHYNINKSSSSQKNTINNQSLIHNKNNNKFLFPNNSTYNIGFKDKIIKKNINNNNIQLPNLNKGFHANIMKFYQMISNK